MFQNKRHNVKMFQNKPGTNIYKEKLDELKELNQQLHDFMNDIKKFILMSRNGKYILI